MTYKQLIEVYKLQHNRSIKSCWIADVKRSMGLPVRIAYNRISLERVVEPCPNEGIRQHIVEIIQQNQ